MKKIIFSSVFIVFFSQINAQLKPESVKKISNQALSKTLTEISFQPEAILEWLCPSRLVRGDKRI